MWDKQHQTITRDALKAKIPAAGAKFVGLGNYDSDKGTGASYNIQHFHYPSKTNTNANMDLILSCRNYIGDCVKYASLLFLGEEDPLHPAIGFYFLGRALHCAQDFYAHSNGVAIKHTVPQTVLNSKAPDELKFCLPTSDNTSKPLAQLMKNTCNGVFCHPTGLKTSKEEIEAACNTLRLDYRHYSSWKNPKDRKKLLLVIAIQSNSLMGHQHMHLDFSNSLADMAMKKILKIGYKQAEVCARAMSAMIFDNFESKITGHNVVDHSAKDQLNLALHLYGVKRIDLTKSINVEYKTEVLRKMRTYRPPSPPKLEKKKRREMFDMCLSVGEYKGAMPST
ncbi:MAG: hypothetical protein HN742_02065 [Lentisphaerae bacterium]|nr:hypothetical protein [Lentisphaerota bacterium]MBT7060047.1 hypothetical protein [Lentisphaerota bacterium]MBT7840623.1 hypothetical protein [Lentisphaerota bacterium]